MTMPGWWGERRFGLIVHASAATVPAWAPIGESAERYRGLLDDDVDDVGETPIHPRPMVEAIAHHRERWGHLAGYDDFAPLLSFDRFDAESWAELARDAGAGYLVHVVKHHDGWAWWDAPGSTRRFTDVGPCRNVLGELAAACERNDLVLAASYSLLDWGTDAEDDEGTAALHADVADLVERFGVRALWGDAHQRHDAGRRRTAELLGAVRALDADIVINDRWWASSSDVPSDGPEIVRTFDRTVPDDIVVGPWEMRRAIGHSAALNRNERPEHHLTGVEVVDLFTEVVAKGGHLLLAVGPGVDGTIPATQTAPLRDAGTWIRRHAEIVASATPWSTWGDDDVRYLDTPTGLLAIDVAGIGRFAALDTSSWLVVDVESFGSDGQVSDRLDAISWSQDDDGLHVTATPERRSEEYDPIGIAVYRIRIEPVERPFELFAPVDAEPIALAPLLDGVSAGAIVQLGDGVYVGPASVPDGVTVRGLGPDRTSVRSPATDTIVPPGPTIELGRDSRLEHLCVTAADVRADRFARPLVHAAAPSSTILGCTIDGSMLIEGDDVLVRAVTGQGLIAVNADRLHVSRCNFTGNRWDIGIELRGGGGQQIESNRLDDHLCAVRASEATGATIRGNSIAARWWGIHLDHTEDAHVHGNRVRSTMRAVDIDGGTQAVVDGNAVTDGDSGCIVQDGAADCEVYGNHWDRCRVGLLAWDATSLHHQDNTCSSLHEPDAEFLSGP